jgi:hypothetical protein
MAREILAAREVQVASVRVHSDGGGPNLKVTDRGSSWAFRFTAPDGRHREMGFGPATRGTLAQAGKSLTNARAKADWARALLARGIDPMDHQQAERDAVRAKLEAKKAAEKSERLTLCRVARAYHEKSVEPRRTTKHAAQWIASPEQGVPAAIRNKPIADVTAYELLDAIAALQLRVPEAASRVRQRLEVIFDDAEFHGLCTSNPAKIIKRKLAERPKGRESGHFAALPYAEIPGFVKALRDRTGVSARALEFALLTAARTGEVLGATWGEIDAQAGI